MTPTFNEKLEMNTIGKALFLIMATHFLKVNTKTMLFSVNDTAFRYKLCFSKFIGISVTGISSSEPFSKGHTFKRPVDSEETYEKHHSCEHGK